MSLWQPVLQKLKFLNRIELSLLTNVRLQNLDDFVAVSRGVLQTGPRKSVGPNYHHLHPILLQSHLNVTKIQSDINDGYV